MMNLQPLNVMDYYKIRETIAESGKTRINDMVAYIKGRYPDADAKLVRSTARELAAEIKRSMRYH
jgi:predicted SnoaL-like aldol condensation-catalyzing enzyme